MSSYRSHFLGSLAWWPVRRVAYNFPTSEKSLFFLMFCFSRYPATCRVQDKASPLSTRIKYSMKLLPKRISPYLLYSFGNLHFLIKLKYFCKKIAMKAHAQLTPLSFFRSYLNLIQIRAILLKSFQGAFLVSKFSSPLYKWNLRRIDSSGIPN